MIWEWILMVFTKRETELMDFLWSYGEPVTGKDILVLCKKRTWADNYLGVMLRSLEKKGAIRCCGMKLYGTKYARQFESTISREEYYVQLAKGNGVDVEAFAKAAVGEPTNHLDMPTIEKLEKIIKEFKERG